MDKISIVVPCFNEEEAISVYYRETCRVMQRVEGAEFEIIFVDDGSIDGTFRLIKAWWAARSR